MDLVLFTKQLLTWMRFGLQNGPLNDMHDIRMDFCMIQLFGWFLLEHLLKSKSQWKKIGT